MKTIIFTRHAKSSWEYNVPDKERPLKKRGITDANLVSKKFKSRDISIDKIYSSPANRAFSTCKIFIKNLERNIDDVGIIDDLYDFGGQSVLNFLKSMDNKLNSVMIFGHNHAFTSLVNSLGSENISNLPTSGLAHIEIDTDNWEEIKNGTTIEIITPKDIKDKLIG